MSEVKCQELFVQSRNAMGTIFTIYLYANNGTRAGALFEAAFEEVERLEETLSNYRETSELSRINRLAARQAVTTDPEVFALLQACLVYSQRSNGAFDVTVGPLMRAWGFFRGKGRYPTSGLRYDSPLDPERSVADHVHALAFRLEAARAGLLRMKRTFQSNEHGSIQLTMFTFRPTESIEFLLDAEDLAVLAEVCTSIRVSTVGDPEPIEVK